MYNLFLDDERFPQQVTWVKLPEVEWTIVRNYDQFVTLITEKGLPENITFDHDLALEHYKEGAKSGFREFDYNNVKEKTGMECAKWLVDYCLDNGKKLPEWYVHTMNTCGVQNISGLLASFQVFQQTTPELFDK